MYINMPIITFSHRLNSIMCRSVYKINKDYIIQTKINESSIVHIILGDKPDDLFSVYCDNLDYSLYTLSEFNYTNWNIEDVIMTAIEHELDGNKFPSDKQFVARTQRVMNREFWNDNKNVRMSYLLKIYDRLDFEWDSNIGKTSLKNYKKGIWKIINTEKYRTFVGEYRFKQLEKKYH